MKKAFIISLPVMAGYFILGIGFGILLSKTGYGPFWAFLMSLCVYAGSMQFASISLIQSQATILTTIITTLVVNARHLFYSIAMLAHYQKADKKKKPYLIFSLTDETFSLVSDQKKDIDTCFWISLFNQSYWVIGSTLGAFLGSYLPFNTSGIEFSMTALFVASFVEEWTTTKDRKPSIVGLIGSLIALILFGAVSFLIPAMLIIFIYFSIQYKKEDQQ